jgi:hypothetical protein
MSLFSTAKEATRPILGAGRQAGLHMLHREALAWAHS